MSKGKLNPNAELFVPSEITVLQVAARQLNKEGVVEFKQGRYLEAFNKFDAAVWNSEGVPGVSRSTYYSNRAEASLAMEQYNDAISAAGEALNVDSANQHARNILARTLNRKGVVEFRQGQYEKAVKYFGMACGVDVSEVEKADYLYHRARSLLMLGKYGEAIKVANEAIGEVEILTTCVGSSKKLQECKERAQRCKEQAAQAESSAATVTQSSTEVSKKPATTDGGTSGEKSARDGKRAKKDSSGAASDDCGDNSGTKSNEEKQKEKSLLEQLWQEKVVSFELKPFETNADKEPKKKEENNSLRKEIEKDLEERQTVTPPNVLEKEKNNNEEEDTSNEGMLFNKSLYPTVPEGGVVKSPTSFLGEGTHLPGDVPIFEGPDLVVSSGSSMV
jgi:tetratricopeptide (TPR) repeat protein